MKDFLIATILSSSHVESPITVELQNAVIWKQFHSVGTEMIVTRSGRRLFPPIRITVKGLTSNKLYRIGLEFRSADPPFRYRYSFRRSAWLKTGIDTTTGHGRFMHPSSASAGSHWMAGPVMFDMVKISNDFGRAVNGNVALKSMRKYVPVVLLTDVSTGVLTERTLAIAEFIAVTAYQNQQITQLKIALNPFAKGFRDALNEEKILQRCSELSKQQGS